MFRKYKNPISLPFPVNCISKIIILMESERSNNTPPHVPLTDEKIYLTLNMKVHSTEVSFITRFNPLHLPILKGNPLKGDPKHVLCVINPIHYSNLMELTWNQSRDCPVFIASILDALLFP